MFGYRLFLRENEQEKGGSNSGVKVNDDKNFEDQCDTTIKTKYECTFSHNHPISRNLDYTQDMRRDI